MQHKLQLIKDQLNLCQELTQIIYTLFFLIFCMYLKYLLSIFRHPIYKLMNFHDWFLDHELEIIKKQMIKDSKGKKIVVVVHGALQTASSSFYRSTHYFMKKGIVFLPVEYKWNQSVKKSSATVKKEINSILKQTKAKKIILVGHSLGGIVARYYMTFLGGKKYVKKLITIGTPHYGGTDPNLQELFWLYFKKELRKDLERDGKFLNQLNKKDCFKNHVCFASGLDPMVSQDNATFHKAKKTIVFPFLSHVDQLYDKKVLIALEKEIKRT